MENKILVNSKGKAFFNKNNNTILSASSTFGGGGGNTLKAVLDATKSAMYLFYNYKGKNHSELIQFNDTENVGNFQAVFYYNTYLKTIPINISNAKSLRMAFMGCTGLKELVINSTSVTDYSQMCTNDDALVKLDISKFTCKTTNESYGMFQNCYLLKALIIRSFGESYVLSSNSFTHCWWLLGETNSSHNPNGEQGYLYVPRDMISILQNETNWSTLQFRPLEEYIIPNADGSIDLLNGEFDDVKAGLV